MNLSRYFSLEELTHSGTAKRLGLSNLPNDEHAANLSKLANAVLDPLREAVGAPIKVSSGYRSPQVNANIRGASNTSQHSLGQAADLQPTDIHVLELFKTVIRLGLPYDQVIYEAKNATSIWVHVSHKEGANRGEIRIAKFDAQGNPLSYPLVTAEQALAMVEPAASGQSRGPAAAVVFEYEEHGDEPVSQAPAAKKPVSRKKAASKAPAKAAPAKKAAVAKPAAKKIAAKAPASKKAAAKKAPAKQAAAKSVATKKGPAKKAAVKKAVVKKAAVKKTPAKKAAAKKAPAKKAPAKQAPARKAVAKPAARKPAARKASRR